LASDITARGSRQLAIFKNSWQGNSCNIKLFRMRFNLLIGLLLSVISIHAQDLEIKGVISEGKDPAIGAVVTLLSNDSSLIKGTATDVDGAFVLKALEPGPYLMKITYLGFKDQFSKIELADNLDLGTILLKQDVKQLQEVEVVTEAVMATQNGDTSSFNARAFKTNPDATAEDLVKKMPGITVVDGKVQAQGEDVRQVLVDGQTFFGDDAAAVLKNLPSEVIEKVQVFDQKSDQAKFTGFDDGNTSKTINIVTKAEFRNGEFGKVYGGYGTDDRYRTGGVLNRFRNKQRLTLMVMSNNVNEQNFSSDDLLGVSQGSNKSGSSTQRGGRNNFSDNSNNFMVNVRNGISSTNALGLNYSDNFGKKTTLNASYLFNETTNRSQTDLVRQYVVGINNGLRYAELSSALSDNYNHRLNMRIESKLDSMNSILFRPSVVMQFNRGQSSLIGSNTSGDILLSTINNTFRSDLQAVNLSVPAQFRHRFAKPGRSFSFELTPTYNKSGGKNAPSTFNRFFGDTAVTDTLVQHSNMDKNGYGGSAEVAYTEPLSKGQSLSLSYEAGLTNSNSDKSTFVLDRALQDFGAKDSLLSNSFSSHYISQSAGPGYRYYNKKISFNTAVMYQYAQLSKTETFPRAQNDSKIFESVLPRATLRFNITPKKNLRVNYRSSTQAPTIEQMQDVVNNNNTLQLSTGNPFLKQTFNNRIDARYSAANTEKQTSMFFLLGGNFANNYISNSTFIAGSDTVILNGIALKKGSQLTRPVNLTGQFSLRSFANYTFPVRKIKSNLNLNMTLNHNHTPALVNDQVNYSDNSTAGVGFVLSSNISEKIDFTISSSPSYNFVTNSLQSNLNSKYFIQTSRIKLVVTPLDRLQLQADFNNQVYRGLSGGFNQNIALLNASVAYKLLKSRNAEIRLYVFDILKQNKSITRTTTETYIEDLETTMLQRYFMLSFTWNFKRFVTQK
jgi:outer membrane receptor protein involved in Fe transport